MAKRFDGSTQYYTVGGVSDFNFFHQTGIFTAAVHFKLDDYTADQLQGFVGSSVATAQKGFAFFYDNRVAAGSPRRLYCQIVRGQSGQYRVNAYCDGDVSDNNWHHLAIRCTGSAIAFWMDGTSLTVDSSAFNADTTGDASSAALAGAIHPASPFYMDGNLADVALWSVDLGDGVAKALSLGFSPRFFRPDALALHTFEPQSAIDLSGNKLTITATNAPTEAAHSPVIYPVGARSHEYTAAGASPITGTAAGSSTTSGDLTGSGALDGTAAGAATVSGALAGAGALAGDSAGAATTSGALTGTGDLAGTAAGVAAASGALVATGALAGTSAGIAATTGTLTGSGALTGTSAGAGAASGAIVGTGALAGAAAGTSTATGVLNTKPLELSGSYRWNQIVFRRVAPMVSRYVDKSVHRRVERQGSYE